LVLLLIGLFALGAGLLALGASYWVPLSHGMVAKKGWRLILSIIASVIGAIVMSMPWWGAIFGAVNISKHLK
jgi:hypothetical protein